MGDIPYQTIFTVSESPLRFGLIYAGTDDGRVQGTKDGGKTWSEMTAGAAPVGVTDLASQFDGHGLPDAERTGRRLHVYVWKSTDFGRTWTSLAEGIPSGR